MTLTILMVFVAACSGEVGDGSGNAGAGGFAGDGAIVMTPVSRNVCHSTDGGQNWSLESLPSALRANGVWNGSEFMAWNFSTLYRSSDGKNWTSRSTVPSNIDFGVAAASDQGTIVGISNAWEQHYDAQVFYRSEDGVHWDVLSSDAYTAGHPIQVITFGYGQPSAHCPR